MIYLLYGPDTYRSRKKLHEIVDAYRAKIGPRIDLHWLDLEESDVALLQEASGTPSLFSQKKLIVCLHALAPIVAQEKLVSLLKKSKGSEDVIVILQDECAGEEAKKRLAELLPLSDKSQEFALLAGEKLARWICHEGSARGAVLGPQEQMRLTALGSDLWVIANEIEKLAVSRTSEVGGRGLEVGARQSTIFALGDAFFSDRRAALGHLFSLLENGADDRELFSYLVNHLRTLLIVQAYALRGEPVPQSLGIHPYVVKKTLTLAREIGQERLEKMFSAFFEEDVRVKTGGDRPQESLIRILCVGREEETSHGLRDPGV